jgi:NAD-dependent deacetylase
MKPIHIDDSTFLFVLTGAGVSAESGVPTFRDSNGLWEKHPVEKVASPEGFEEDPALVWRFYSQRRAGAKVVSPNAGHFALAAIEQKLGDRFLLATQNVDGLHSKAGSKRVVEMHGSLWKTRCSNCDREPFADDAEYSADKLPGCKACSEKGTLALLRPHIVWFGENLDPENLEAISAFFLKARGKRFVFIAAGTSGAVWPAAGLVKQARALGAETWLINAEPSSNAGDFEHVQLGKSGELLPKLLAVE